MKHAWVAQASPYRPPTNGRPWRWQRTPQQSSKRLPGSEFAYYSWRPPWCREAAPPKFVSQEFRKELTQRPTGVEEGPSSEATTTAGEHKRPSSHQKWVIADARRRRQASRPPPS